MRKKRVITGIVILILVSAGFFYFKQKTQAPEIDDSLEFKLRETESRVEQGIKNSADLVPQYEKISAKYYFTHKYCADVFRESIKKLDGKVELVSISGISTMDGQVPSQRADPSEDVAMLYGSAVLYDTEENYVNTNNNLVTYILGSSTCSERVLISSICAMLKNRPPVCVNFPIKEKAEEKQVSYENDYACYRKCLVRYSYNDSLFTQLWQGPPCGRLETYRLGQSVIYYRTCDQQSCRTKPDDFGCCRKNECVENEKCYASLTKRDVGNDGHTEICGGISGQPVWINPDKGLSECTDSGYKWIQCAAHNQCETGLDDYSKSQELCCGDDKGENSIKCKGSICVDEDYGCCSSSSCVYKGSCYPNGCNTINDEGATFTAFCEGSTNRWTDLDESHCSECLSQKSWSGTRCCGDDNEEGTIPTKFIVNNKNGTIPLLYFGCTQKASDCVYPFSELAFKEGVYEFKEESPYFRGAYYCSNSQWYSLDYNQKFCEASDNKYDSRKKICCGDDKEEYFITGSDKTSACCSSKTDKVIDSNCIPVNSCGNNITDYGEECETPNSDNNRYCSQTQFECLDRKLGTRAQNGYCGRKCSCEQTEFKYSCTKGACGAQCSSNNDCDSDKRCNPETCGCVPKQFCGDGVIQIFNDLRQSEECEPPNSAENSNCKVEQCKERKSIFNSLGINLTYGRCKGNCKCDYKSIEYSCRKNICGAECSEDGTGCELGNVCNVELCACTKALVCGNNVCEEGEKTSCPNDCRKNECPYRIDLKIDKKTYYLDDTINMQIYIYNKENEPLQDTRFDLDVVLNDFVVGSSTLATDSSGFFNLTKKVTVNMMKGMQKFIVKSAVPGCEIVSDVENAYIYVNNPADIFSKKLNYSKYSYVVDKFNVTSEKIKKAVCGDKVIGYGEACEGSNICRKTTGCDYASRMYDNPESCYNCDCLDDVFSNESDETYCRNCNHCGDLKVNCNEQCENGTIESGFICRNRRLFKKINSCLLCKWNDDGINNDQLADTCDCKCQKSPEVNCISGNYINYTPDYNAGCTSNKCNTCNCVDTYTKDVNKDGIDDKCGIEYCGNGLDDNDDGRIDEQGCIWYYCSQCGQGLLRFCTRNECSLFKQGCHFGPFDYALIENNNGFGSCGACSEIKFCEEYEKNNATCQQNPCNLGKCDWINESCCSENDNDGICDSEDNCPLTYNPNQKDTDKDGRGDICDKCPLENKLYIPTEEKELSCDDGIDNDCDDKIDCNDENCAGILNCCTINADCAQDKCAIETCKNNSCSYENRPVCDNAECEKGSYCSLKGVCEQPENSSDVCLNCVADLTKNDNGIGFGHYFDFISEKNLSACCGNNASEQYSIGPNKKTCCTSNRCIEIS